MVVGKRPCLEHLGQANKTLSGLTRTMKERLEVRVAPALTATRLFLFPDRWKKRAVARIRVIELSLGTATCTGAFVSGRGIMGRRMDGEGENGVGYDFACSEYRKTALNEEIAVVRVSGIMPAGDASIRGLFCEVVSVCLSVQILIPLSHLSLVYICKIPPSNTPTLTTCPLMALAPAPCMPQN